MIVDILASRDGPCGRPIALIGFALLLALVVLPHCLFCTGRGELLWASSLKLAHKAGFLVTRFRRKSSGFGFCGLPPAFQPVFIFAGYFLHLPSLLV